MSQHSSLILAATTTFRLDNTHPRWRAQGILRRQHQCQSMQMRWLSAVVIYTERQRLDTPRRIQIPFSNLRGSRQSDQTKRRLCGDQQWPSNDFSSINYLRNEVKRTSSGERPKGILNHPSSLHFSFMAFRGFISCRKLFCSSARSRFETKTFTRMLHSEMIINISESESKRGK